MTSFYIPAGTTLFGPSTPSYQIYNNVTGNDEGDSITGGFAGAMNITGGAGADHIAVTNAVTSATIYGGAGADYIDLSAEHTNSTNYLYGGSGDDTLIGAPGSVNVFVGDGNVSMVGGSAPLVPTGQNTFYTFQPPEAGGPTIVGGNGENNIYYVQSSRTDIHLGTGYSTNEVFLYGLGYNTVSGTGIFHTGDSVEDNSAGYNLIQSTASGFSATLYGITNDTIIGGGTQFDFTDQFGSANSFTGNLDSGFGTAVQLLGASHDTVTGGGTISDTGYQNQIRTSNTGATVWATTADGDTIVGGNGDDTIHIGGRDAYFSTQVTGGGGDDTIDGTGGKSVLYIQPGTGSGINVVTGDDVSNHIYGQFTGGTLFMRGGAGPDEMVGGNGSNTFIGAGGGDFVGSGGTANAFDFNSQSDGNLHVTNFNANTDHFGIFAPNFGDLSGGETLTVGYNLINGTSSVANTGTFLYSSGLLYFDADGTGSVAPTLLAGLSGSVPASLSPNNFAISGSKF